MLLGANRLVGGRPVALSRSGAPVLPVPATRSSSHAFSGAYKLEQPNIVGAAPRASKMARRSARGAVRVEAFFNKIFKNDPSEGTRKKYQSRVDQINALEPSMQALTDDQLRAKTQEFKERVRKGESLESILPEAFAVST